MLLIISVRTLTWHFRIGAEHCLRPERHLEKTPVQYIQWRYQSGYDREVLEKTTRALTDEDKALLDTDFVGKNGTKRKMEVRRPHSIRFPFISSPISAIVHHGPTEVEEVAPV